MSHLTVKPEDTMTQEVPQQDRAEYHFSKFMDAIDCDESSRSKILKFIDSEHLSNHIENE